jgi:hypothetical protein
MQVSTSARTNGVMLRRMCASGLQFRPLNGADAASGIRIGARMPEPLDRCPPTTA